MKQGVVSVGNLRWMSSCPFSFSSRADDVSWFYRPCTFSIRFDTLASFPQLGFVFSPFWIVVGIIFKDNCYVLLFCSILSAFSICKDNGELNYSASFWVASTTVSITQLTFLSGAVLFWPAFAPGNWILPIERLYLMESAFIVFTLSVSFKLLSEQMLVWILDMPKLGFWGLPTISSLLNPAS